MNNKLRDEMHFLHGQIAAAGFFSMEQGQSDLWESIQSQYEKIMNEILLPTNNFQSLHPCNHAWSCVKCGENHA